jgi:hypothetical protein
LSSNSANVSGLRRSTGHLCEDASYDVSDE